jgi:hypothetical protein
MADETNTRGAIPIDLDGALELARAADTPESRIAAQVYEEAKAGTIPLAVVRDVVLVRQLEAGV